MEHHYHAIQEELAASIQDLNLSDSDKSNLLRCFNAWLALEWCHDAKLIAPNHHNLKELKAIIAALQDSGYGVEQQNTYEYKLRNIERGGRFWWWEAKGKWIADFGWIERLIQQVLASPELQIRLPELPINKTYMNDDIEVCLSHHKISQQEAKESLNQMKADLVAFLDKRLQEIPGPIDTGMPEVAFRDSNVTSPSTESEANSQAQTKWWQFWRRY